MRMLMRKSMILFTAVAMLLSSFVHTASAGTQATYYASPTGSGSVCSLSAPCSLTGVRDKVRGVNAGMSGDILIMLRGGTYNLTSALTLDYRDSGFSGYKVIWQNYPGEEPLLSGGQSLSGGWVVADSSKNLYKKTGVTLEFRQLYVNGVPAIRARIPNLTDPDTLGPYYKTVSGDTANKQYKINKAEISSWGQLNKVEMVTQPHWYHNRLRIASYTTDASYAYVSFLSPEQGNAFNKSASYYTSNAYHMENAYELLDAQGEWYLDTAADVLYYKPRPGELMSTASFIVPAVDVLVNLAGTAANPIHDVEWSGITFSYSGWNGPSSTGLVATQGANPVGTSALPGAVQAAYGSNLKFTGNTFTKLGATALKLGNGIKDSFITGNSFHTIAANGIELKSPRNAAAGELSENVVIGNNTITRVGQQYANGMGVLAYCVKNLVVEHNDISYMPYMGIQVGGQGDGYNNMGMGSNMIRFNNIHHVMQLYDDGGAVYTLGRQPGTYVYENYIHDITKSTYAMSSPVAALYMDNYSEFIIAEHNVLSGINTASGALLTYEQTGTVSAKNNQWVNNGTQDQAVIQKAGVKTSYTEPALFRVRDSFNTGTTGNAPTGWSTAASSGTIRIAEIPSTSDKSVWVNKASAAGNTTSGKALATPLTGIVTVQALVRAEQTAGWKMAPYIADSTGAQAVAVAFDGGYIKAYNGSALTNVQSFTPGVWYDIQAVLDTASGTFDLYIDGVRRITDGNFRNPVTNIKTVSFGIGDGHQGAFYYDDVKVLAP
jgi:hypothetical protein